MLETIPADSRWSRAAKPSPTGLHARRALPPWMKRHSMLYVSTSLPGGKVSAAGRRGGGAAGTARNTPSAAAVRKNHMKPECRRSKKKEASRRGRHSRGAGFSPRGASAPLRSPPSAAQRATMSDSMDRSKPLIAAAVLCILAGCHKAPPANVAATINTRPITYEEVDRIYQSQLSSPGATSDDLAQIQKLEVLRSLIESEIMLQRAEKMGIMATDAEVDAKFAELKAPYTQEEFQKLLETRKMTVPDLKKNLRRDLSVQKLVNKEITSKISITDREIAEFYANNRASFNRAEPAVHLAQILVTSAPDATVRNLKNDKAQNDDQARKKIQNLEARIRQGEDFSMLAENFSEDVNSSPNGGDLGFVPLSAFDGSSPEVKKLIATMQPGQVSPIIPSQQAYRILKLISREPAGQRDLNDPRVQQTIREGLLSRKDQLLRNAYYEVARDEATVVNYYARKILETKAQ